MPACRVGDAKKRGAGPTTKAFSPTEDTTPRPALPPALQWGAPRCDHPKAEISPETVLAGVRSGSEVKHPGKIPKRTLARAQTGSENAVQ